MGPRMSGDHHVIRTDKIAAFPQFSANLAEMFRIVFFERKYFQSCGHALDDGQVVFRPG